MSKIHNLKAGFTLVETLVVIIMAGILASIAYPNMMGLIKRQALNTSNNKIYYAMKQAQNQAKAQNTVIQLSVIEQNDVVKWAIHKAGKTPNYLDQLEQEIKIEPSNTNLPQSSGVWNVKFDHNGYPQDEAGNINLGRITLTLENNNNEKRCVEVTNLLGSLEIKGAKNKADCE